MRPIKFRGKDIESGEWLYGDLRQRLGYWPAIIESYCTGEGKVGYREVAVAEETVGQFTGMRDKNGRDIYEGDIIRLKELYGNFSEAAVSFCDKGYWAINHGINERVIAGFVNKEQIEVVGNIHDNPNMIKRK